MFLAHPASGLTTAYFSRKLWDRKEYSPKQRSLLYSSSIVSAFLPDLDIAYAALHGLENHRNYITHTPVLYLSIAITLFLSALFFKPKFKHLVTSFAILFLISTMTHIITDALGGTMRLFYPLSNESFPLFSVNPIVNVHDKIINYLLTPVFGLLELLWLVSSFYILLFRLNRHQIQFKLLLLTQVVSCIIVCVSISIIIAIV
ncbi:MAG: metal-dependent hydrolase [Patescibacteria group bacterium]|nr:metal-dependent hydrolase [Patescibacteria group bacterium]